MKDKRMYETLRSERAGFDRDFSDYVIEKQKEGWKVEGCSFFQDNDGDRKWAFCTFGR